MPGRRLNGQQQNAMFTMRHRASADLRALASSHVSEAEMEDLVADGYVKIMNTGSGGGRRSWALTARSTTRRVRDSISIWAWKFSGVTARSQGSAPSSATL